MSNEVAATLTEMEGALSEVGADAEFLLSQLRAGATLSAASHAWMQVLHERNKNLTSRVQASSKTKTGSYKAITDNKPEREGSTSGGSATADWNAAVDAITDKGIPKAKAIQKVVRENPEIHQAYLEEVNAGRNV